jgi:DNA-binding transcriptional regulator PaaX
MGHLEQETKKRAGRKNVAEIILRAVATAGLLSAALVAPNALKAIRTLGLLPHQRQKEVIRRAQTRLVGQGLLARNANGYLRLTQKGEENLAYLERNNFEKWRQQNIPRRWDKKWRILIFDIKEERRMIRDYIRRKLESIGFQRIQDSVFVFPYDCEDLIALLKADFKVGYDLLYIIADTIENDGSLRKYFHLPPQ